MRGGDEVVKLSPRITRAEVFLDAFEVARLVTVIGSRRITTAVRNICVEIIDGGEIQIAVTPRPARYDIFC